MARWSPTPRGTSARRAASRSTGARSRPSRARSGRVNKPAGVVSTAQRAAAKPPRGHRAGRALSRRLYPVGRLDADSTGLILLTNDGELANRLTHPRYGVPKTYRVSLARPPGRARDRAAAYGGVQLDDGPTAPAEVERRGERELEITIREGRKRQLRRMAEAVGNRVEALTRIRIGSLELGDLRPGEARRLSDDEVESLWEDARPMERRRKGAANERRRRSALGGARGDQGRRATTPRRS